MHNHENPHVNESNCIEQVIRRHGLLCKEAFWARAILTNTLRVGDWQIEDQIRIKSSSNFSDLLDKQKVVATDGSGGPDRNASRVASGAAVAEGGEPEQHVTHRVVTAGAGARGAAEGVPPLWAQGCAATGARGERRRGGAGAGSAAAREA